jgi:pilus assembly protein CpaE
MAHLVAVIISHDDALRTHVAWLFKSAATPVSVMEDGALRTAAPPDLVVVDARGDWQSSMSRIEGLRTSMPAASIFAIAPEADTESILEAMRAGANEFFPWAPPEETFHAAIQRAAARRQTTPGVRAGATTYVFVGSKGGVGTTTIAINTAVEVSRLSKRPTAILDLRAGLGEVGLFLDVRPKYTIVDALDNLQQLDRDFLQQLVASHKSGLDVLVGSDQFDRPGPGDGPALEELIRFLSRQYDHLLIDAGSNLDACAIVALYAADKIFLVATPDVASVRNSQRVLHRVQQLGACSDRVNILLNRSIDPLPIPLNQIEAAVGYPVRQKFSSDFKTASTAMNSGVPLILAGNSAISEEFDEFTRGLIDAEAEEPEAKQSRVGLKLARAVSLW